MKLILILTLLLAAPAAGQEPVIDIVGESPSAEARFGAAAKKPLNQSLERLAKLAATSEKVGGALLFYETRSEIGTDTDSLFQIGAQPTVVLAELKAAYERKKERGGDHTIDLTFLAFPGIGELSAEDIGLLLRTLRAERCETGEIQ